MTFCTPRNKTKIVMIVLAALILLAASAYSDYLYPKHSWSQTLTLNSLMQMMDRCNRPGGARGSEFESRRSEHLMQSIRVNLRVGQDAFIITRQPS
jgi:hypothetical protein